MKSANISIRLTIESCSSAASALPSWLTGALAPAVALAVALGGWVIVERFARARERRSEMRLLVDAFAEAVDEIVATANAFFLLPGNDLRARSLATNIRVKIKTLADLIDTLRRSGCKVRSDEELKIFRQVITGGEFDSLARAQAPTNAAVFDDIAAAGQQLSRVVRLAFYDTFVAKKEKGLVR